MKRSRQSFDLALSFLHELDKCAEEYLLLEESSNEIRKICRTDSNMDIGKSMKRTLSESSLLKYQESAISQNDYLVDFLHSDSFWIDIIAMGVKANDVPSSDHVSKTIDTPVHTGVVDHPINMMFLPTPSNTTTSSNSSSSSSSDYCESKVDLGIHELLKRTQMDNMTSQISETARKMSSLNLCEAAASATCMYDEEKWSD